MDDIIVNTIKNICEFMLENRILLCFIGICVAFWILRMNIKEIEFKEKELKRFMSFKPSKGHVDKTYLKLVKISLLLLKSH